MRVESTRHLGGINEREEETDIVMKKIHCCGEQIVGESRNGVNSADNSRY